MKKLLAILMVFVIGVSLVSCVGGGDTKTTKVEKTTPDTYPLDTDVELKAYFANFTPNALASSVGDTEFAKYLEEATGIKVTYESPAPGTVGEAWNLLLASDNLPDILMSGAMGLDPSQQQEWLDTGVVIALDPYLEAGIMPNLKKIFDENPELADMAKTFNGEITYAPMILEDDSMRSYMVYIIRQDLLDKLDLESPETIEEWETVLRAFKKAGIKAPLTVGLSAGELDANAPFYGGFGLGLGFYQVDGKVTHAYNEPAFKDWLKTMARWYKDGLLDSEYLDQDTTRINQLMTSGQAGATIKAVGGGLGTYMNAVTKESGIKFGSTKVPAVKKGEKAMMHQTQYRVHSAGASITGDCKNPEIAARWIDFGYSELGQRIWNFGKEGISYTMAVDEDGNEYPKYTDMILTPADKSVTRSQMLGLHTMVSLPVSVQSKYYFQQNNGTPEQQQALKYANDTDVDKYMLPKVLLSAEQKEQINDLWTPISTYVGETIAQIITGRVDVEKGYKELSKKIDELGMEDVLDIYQEAYDAKKAK